jgi:hypothetical protein
MADHNLITVDLSLCVHRSGGSQLLCSQNWLISLLNRPIWSR